MKITPVTKDTRGSLRCCVSYPRIFWLSIRQIIMPSRSLTPGRHQVGWFIRWWRSATDHAKYFRKVFFSSGSPIPLSRMGYRILTHIGDLWTTLVVTALRISLELNYASTHPEMGKVRYLHTSMGNGDVCGWERFVYINLLFIVDVICLSVYLSIHLQVSFLASSTSYRNYRRQSTFFILLQPLQHLGHQHQSIWNIVFRQV